MTLAKNVDQEVRGLADIVAGNWYSRLIQEMSENNIVSPIEQIFYAHWHFKEHSPHVELLSQHKIGQYKVDFLVSPISFFVNSCDGYNYDSLLTNIDKDIQDYAVELDGHEFHEKTKEQVEKDKKRERFLVSKGLIVMRFSGREIYKNPFDCVNEVFEQAWEQMPEIITKWREVVRGKIS
jgi:very-short-patch-repair endonuclease